MYSLSRKFMSNFLPIGIRLKEERDKLALSQTEFADLGGVGRKTQFNYESGERAPDGAYLAAIAAAGADVLYILTGTRSAPVVPASPALPADLTASQRKLLRDHAAATEDGQKMIEGAAAFAAAQAVPERLKKRA
jgi:transcriptional regulator with XRE-family HTH domain